MSSSKPGFSISESMADTNTLVDGSANSWLSEGSRRGWYEDSTNGSRLSVKISMSNIGGDSMVEPDGRILMLTCPLAGSLAGSMAGSLADSLAGSLAGSLADSLADSLAGALA